MSYIIKGTYDYIKGTYDYIINGIPWRPPFRLTAGGPDHEPFTRSACSSGSSREPWRRA